MLRRPSLHPLKAALLPIKRVFFLFEEVVFVFEFEPSAIGGVKQVGVQLDLVFVSLLLLGRLLLPLFQDERENEVVFGGEGGGGGAVAHFAKGHL